MPTGQYVITFVIFAKFVQIFFTQKRIDFFNMLCWKLTAVLKQLTVSVLSYRVGRLMNSSVLEN